MTGKSLVLSYYLDYLNCIEKKLPAFPCLTPFAAAHPPPDGWFLCVHLCFTLSDVHSGQWWVGRWSFFLIKLGRCSFILATSQQKSPLCYPFLYGQADIGWALVSQFPSTSTGCTLYSLEVYWVSKSFLPTWFFHHGETYFLVMSKETYKWKCSCLFYFRHFKLCAMWGWSRPGISLKQIKYSTFPCNVG